MKYQLYKTSDSHYEVIHPDGTKFTVPRKGISKEMQEKIDGLPKFAFGGGVGFGNGNATDLGTQVAMLEPEKIGFVNTAPKYDLENELPIQQTVQTQPSTVSQPQISQPIPQQIQQSMQQERVPAQDGFNPLSANQATPSGYDTYSKALDKLGSAGFQGLKSAQKAESTFNASMDALQKQRDQEAANFKNYLAENNKKIQEVANQKIDSNRFWGEMSTPNKILAGLSIAIGGVGAGLTGKSNAALDIINKAIENDIEAQKANKNSLYNGLIQQGQSAKDAHAATLESIIGNIDSQLNKYKASNLTAQQAQNLAELQAKIGVQKAALQMQRDQNFAQNYVNKKASSGAQLSPEEINYMSKETQEKYIPGVGIAAVKPTDSDRKAIASVNNIQGGLKEMINRAKNESFMTVPGSAQDQANKAFLNEMQLQMKDAYQLGALSESDMDMLRSLTADPGAFRSKAAIAKLQTTYDRMEALKNSTYQKLGIPTVNFKRTK